MFGPVMTSMRWLASSRQWLGMNEPAAGLVEARLDDRMAPALDLDARLRDELGPAPLQRDRALGQRRKRIDRGQRARQRRQRREVRLQRVEHLLVQQLLARKRSFLRRQRLVLESLQLRRDVALGVLHRLPAPVVGRYLVDLALRDLDVEAVHAVVLNAQVVDAGADCARALRGRSGKRRSCRRCDRSSSSSASKPAAMTPPSRSSTAGGSAMRTRQQGLDLGRRREREPLLVEQRCAARHRVAQAPAARQASSAGPPARADAPGAARCAP